MERACVNRKINRAAASTSRAPVQRHVEAWRNKPAMRMWRWPRAFVPFHESFTPSTEGPLAAICLTPDSRSVLAATCFSRPDRASAADARSKTRDTRVAVIRQFGLHSHRLIRSFMFEDFVGHVINIQVSGSMKYLLAALSTGEVLLWDVASGDFLLSLWSKHTPNSTAHFIGNEQVAVLSAQMDVVIFRIRDGHVVLRTKVDGEPRVLSMAISHDGRLRRK